MAAEMLDFCIEGAQFVYMLSSAVNTDLCTCAHRTTLGCMCSGIRLKSLPTSLVQGLVLLSGHRRGGGGGGGGGGQLSNSDASCMERIWAHSDNWFLRCAWI